jgi:transposase
MLADLIEEEEMASSLPEAAHAMFRLMLDLLAGLNGKIADLIQNGRTHAQAPPHHRK